MSTAAAFAFVRISISATVTLPDLEHVVAKALSSTASFYGDVVELPACMAYLYLPPVITALYLHCKYTVNTTPVFQIRVIPEP